MKHLHTKRNHGRPKVMIFCVTCTSNSVTQRPSDGALSGLWEGNLRLHMIAVGKMRLTENPV